MPRSLLIALVCLMLTPAVHAQRLRVTVNDGWRFAAGPQEGAEAQAFDDAAWARVDLPHTWNAEDAFDKRATYRRGVGWYRRALPLDASLRGRRLYLYFEGANQKADVYVNGHAAGSHVGGYTAFVVDVTDHVRFDAPNVVAVRVDNAHDDDVPPLNADFTFYGGIYRDVWLLATAPVHLEVEDHAGPGVYIDTPEASAEAAAVRVRAAVVNDSDTAAPVEVVHQILDAEGAEVAVVRAAQTVRPGQRAAFEQTTDPIANPRLWSPEDPYLYTVRTLVRVGGAVVDALDQPLGVRWFGVDGDGLTLNGRPYALYGTNRHQDLPGLGNALPDDAHRRDVRLVKENGFNFLRLAHYPQDPAVLAAADRLGLVVWEEIPVVNKITMTDAFAEHSERMLVEMIRQHYNHPSVLMWGYMNEVLLVLPNPMPEGYYDAVLALARRLEARLKEEDPGRISVTAISNGEVDNGTGFQDIPDILGMNLYFGWYYHDFETLGTFLDDLHRRNPDRPLLVSEYGAGSDERVHTTVPVRFDFSSEHQQNYHRANFALMQARPYLVGTAVWNQYDFGSTHRQDTKNSINQKGLYFFDRTPKDIAYYYKAKLLDEPVLYVAREWDRRAGSRPEDRREQSVWVYTNLDSVELVVNGASFGTQAPENATATWTVPLRGDDNRIEARGRRGGNPIADRVTIHYEDRTAFFTDPASEAVRLAVNAGADYAYTDAYGVVWEADRAYVPGSWGYVGGEARRTHHRVYDTDDDPLHQAVREGAEAYRFDVPDGDYDLRLGFADAAHEAPGARVFGVLANGQPVVSSLDLAAEAGRWTAVERTARVAVRGGEGLTLTFEAAAGAPPLLSSIHLHRLP